MMGILLEGHKANVIAEGKGSLHVYLFIYNFVQTNTARMTETTFKLISIPVKYFCWEENN